MGSPFSWYTLLLAISDIFICSRNFRSNLDATEFSMGKLYFCVLSDTWQNHKLMFTTVRMLLKTAYHMGEVFKQPKPSLVESPPLTYSQTARLRPVFRRKTVFTRRRARIHGASGTKLPFRCNSLRRSTPTGPKGRKAPSGPFSPLGQPARFARRLDKLELSAKRIKQRIHQD